MSNQRRRLIHNIGSSTVLFENVQRRNELRQQRIRDSIAAPVQEAQFVPFAGVGRSTGISTVNVVPSIVRNRLEEMAQDVYQSQFDIIRQTLLTNDRIIQNQINDLQIQLQNSTDEDEIEKIEQKIKRLKEQKQSLTDLELQFANDPQKAINEILNIQRQSNIAPQRLAVLMNRRPEQRQDLFLQDFDSLLIFGAFESQNVPLRDQIIAFLHRVMYQYDTTELEGMNEEQYERARELAQIVPDRNAYELRLYAPQDPTNIQNRENQIYEVVRQGETLQDARQRLLQRLNESNVAMINRAADVVFPLEIAIDPEFYRQRFRRTASLAERYRSRLQQLNNIENAGLKLTENEKNEQIIYSIALEMLAGRKPRKIFTMNTTPGLGASIYDPNGNNPRNGFFTRLGTFTLPTAHDMIEYAEEYVQNQMINGQLAQFVYDLQNALNNNDLLDQSEILQEVVSWLDVNGEVNLNLLYRFAINMQLFDQQDRVAYANSVLGNEIPQDILDSFVNDPKLLLAVVEAIKRKFDELKEIQIRSALIIENPEEEIAIQTIRYPEGPQDVQLVDVTDRESGTVYLRPGAKYIKTQLDSFLTQDDECMRGAYIYSDGIEIPFGTTTVLDDQNNVLILDESGMLNEQLTLRQNEQNMQLPLFITLSNRLPFTLDKNQRALRIQQTGSYLFNATVPVIKLKCIDSNGTEKIIDLPDIYDVQTRRNNSAVIRQKIEDTINNCYNGSYIFDNEMRIPFGTLVAPLNQIPGFALITDPNFDEETGDVSVNRKLTSVLGNLDINFVPNNVKFADAQELELNKDVLTSIDQSITLPGKIQFVECEDGNGNKTIYATSNVNRTRNVDLPPFRSGDRTLYLYPQNRRIILDQIEELYTNIARLEAQLETVQSRVDISAIRSKIESKRKEIESLLDIIKIKVQNLNTAKDEQKKQTDIQVLNNLKNLEVQLIKEIEQDRNKLRNLNESLSGLEDTLASQELAQDILLNIQNDNDKIEELKNQLTIQPEERQQYEQDAANTAYEYLQRRIRRRRIRREYRAEKQAEREQLRIQDKILGSSYIEKEAV